jgi:DNA-binding SARP family transcriptional activator
MTDFRVLGPLEAVCEDGRQLSLGGPKQRALLALLLLHANEVVSTGKLVDELWGERPPPTATASLQNNVAALRKLLGSEVLVTRAPGYVLNVEPGQLDAEVFERRVEEARALDPEPRAAALRAALALWRGPPLAEFTLEAFAEPEVRRLEELQLGAIEDRIEADLESGRAAELVAEVEALVARNPLRERLRGQLMLALYRSGRQADALAEFQNARRLFVEELGIDPGPELQSLHQAILRQEARLHPAAAASTSHDHLEQVAAALLAGRLVPVLGTNVGELAVQLAQRFEYPPGEPGDLARVAQYVALLRGSGPLYDELHALLEQPAEPTPVHRFFAALPPLLRERGSPQTLLVTTSYDLALEQALLDAGEEFDVVFYLAAGRDRGRFCHLRPDGVAHVIDVPNTYATELSLERRTVVLKLHGGVDASPGRERESFVVTEDDYIDYLAGGGAGTSIPVALAAKLRRNHFLFLGYGMRDWNLRLVLGRVWGGEGLSYRSWAVQPDAGPLERQFWRARDVDLLEVPLDEYVGALERYVGLEAGAAA